MTDSLLRKVYATPGQFVYDFLRETLRNVKTGNESGVCAVFTDVKINIYKESCIADICDKFDMQKRINQLESQYRR
jgi:hypothetical protein